MEAPKFDGSDASNWIARVQYYFDHLALPDHERMHYVVMLFQLPASEWIFNYCANNIDISWAEFLEDVRHRFNPQSFTNSIGPLSKLVQTGLVAEYHATFECLLNRIDGLPESTLIPMFIASLKEPIKEKVELQQPLLLATTMALSLRLTASHEERQKQFARNRWQSRDSKQPLSMYDMPAGSAPQLAPSTRVEPRSFKPVRVSNAEKQEHAKNGLCYYCPKKWAPGHICKMKLLSYIGDDEDETSEELIMADLSHSQSLDGNH